jgi:hypothetical protein
MTWRPMMRLIIPAMVLLILALAGCSDGHERLSSDANKLGLDSKFEFLVERRWGPEICFAGGCPAVDRYYLSDAAPEATCEMVAELLEADGLAVDVMEHEYCDYMTTIDNVRFDVVVTGPMTEIPPDDQTLYPFPVRVEHESMIVVNASGGG